MSLHIAKVPYLYLDIWIEVGSEGQVFTYTNHQKIKTRVGDIVKIQLRGFYHVGIVIKGKNKISKELYNYNFKSVYDLVEVPSLDPNWYVWLQDAAKEYNVSFFKMLKRALPVSGLGQDKKNTYSKYVNVRISTKTSINRNINLTNNQLELINWLRKQKGEYLMKSILKENRFSYSTIDTLNKKSIVQKEMKLRSISQRPIKFLNQKFRYLNSFINNDQKEALQTFNNLRLGSGMLLWGVTGSGKTEVYIQAAANQLKAGYNVLILTPEITLIPQLVDRCRKYFSELVLEYNSNCSNTDRAQVWRYCYDSISNPIIVVGTRSAIFLPLNPLGLIVVDEEHDISYKQEHLMPCYNVRDLVFTRSKYCGIRFILGSATPSLEAWRLCHGERVISLARLPKRVRGQLLPEVTILDMRLEMIKGRRHLLSQSLLRQLKSVKSLGEQAIILVPRRGYSSFLGCRSCGTVIECPNCDVALVVHQNEKHYNWLHCHWCDYKEVLMQRCQSCGSNTFKAFGTGTQQVMEELEQILKGFKLIRFDHDTTRGKHKHRELLNQFANGQADILVGTQMLAKGIDLPKVTLSVVLAADSLLHRSDLRSSEQCLQLFLQLAGRAGRGNHSGKMFVQTYCPQHPILRYLVNGNYENFLINELSIRKASRLVPYSRVCLLHFSGISDIITATNAKILAERIRSHCEELGWQLIGPFPAPVARVSGQSRWQVLLQGNEGSKLPLLSNIKLKQIISQKISISIDPNPTKL